MYIFFHMKRYLMHIKVQFNPLYYLNKNNSTIMQNRNRLTGNTKQTITTNGRWLIINDQIFFSETMFFIRKKVQPVLWLRLFLSPSLFYMDVSRRSTHELSFTVIIFHFTPKLFLSYHVLSWKYSSSLLVINFNYF